MSFFVRLKALYGELIGNVIHVYVVDILDGFLPHDFSRAKLDIIKPDVWIETGPFRESAELRQIARAGLADEAAAPPKIAA